MSTIRRSADAVDADSDALWACAEAMARAAAAETLAWFRSAALGIDNKHEARAEGGFDPVTQADRAAEAAMRAVLAEMRPQDGIQGEEFGPRDGTSGLTWVVDPIDGTRAYMMGAPTWGTLISVSDENGPRLGMIDQPYTGERWMGGLGRAEIVRGTARTALRSRGTHALADATLCTTFPEIGSPEERAGFERVAGRARLVRYGLDCYAYGLVACGGVDLVIEAGLAAYDVCAPIAVIEAAGGIVTDWQGGPAHGGGRILAAANETLHAAALEVLNGA
jgi:histidinol phosphatase-like enzyme (inositol monophosphatase family)